MIKTGWYAIDEINGCTLNDCGDWIGPYENFEDAYRDKKKYRFCIVRWLDETGWLCQRKPAS